MEASQRNQPHNQPPNDSSSYQEPEYFAFLRTDEEKWTSKASPFFSENGLDQDIIQVTQAEPDIPLEVFYALHHVLLPQIERQSDVSFKDAWTKFIGGAVHKGSLCPPEKLIIERRVKDVKRAMSGPGGEGQIFQDLDRVLASILNLRQKIGDYPGEVLYKKEITASLGLVQEFYQSYRDKVKELVQTILDKEKIDAGYGSEADALEDLLEPKAIMMSDIFKNHWAYRILRNQAQKLLSLDALGRIIKSNQNDPANHRVVSLPEGATEPLVFFKANGNPPIQPEKEFMLSSLYGHLQIPVPETGLIILTDVFEANPDYFYSVQASEAVLGESPLKAYQNPETTFDHEAYVSQTIGAFLTNPSDGSFKNFKYCPKYKTFVSIDNDEVFKPELTGKSDKEVLNVKSILYLLPQIDNPIPESMQTFFSTLDPRLMIFVWLQDLYRKNREYQLLFTRLAFQRTRCIYQNLLPQSEVPSLSKCLQQKILVDPELHSDSFKPQILVSQSLLNDLIVKFHIIEKILSSNRSVSTQTLLEEISPILGKYYRKLRIEFSNIAEAIEAMWGIKKNDIDYSYVSSLLDLDEFKDLPKNSHQFDEETLPPEAFFKEYQDLLTSGSSPLDEFIRRHNQRKKRNIMNLQITFNELKFLIQQGLATSQSPRDIVDFCDDISKMMEIDPKLIKEITSLLSNLPHEELKWLLTLEKYFLRLDNPPSLTVEGALMKKRAFILTESESQYLFDKQGNIKKNPYLTGRSAVNCFPPEKPEFYLKQYPEWPGYEFASTLFMRSLGVKHLPYQDLLLIHNSPVLLTQKVHGNPVLRIWNNSQAFYNLDPFHTTLLIISAMLINPEDGKEDNFILSPDGKYLIPIDNDHCFFPSTFQKEGSFWNAFTVNTALQTKTILFCLDEMYMLIPLEVKQHILSLNFDSLLTKWMAELDKIENKLNNLVDQNQRNRFLEHGTVMRIPFYKQFIQSMHWKAHKIQHILSAASEITPFELLRIVEPFAARCYEDSFKQGNDLQSRFKAATNNLYKKASVDGSRVSILNTRAMMEVINVSVEELQNDVAFQRMGPIDSLELLNQLSQEHSEKVKREQEMLCELDEKKQETSWISLFGNPPGEAALKAFLENPKEALVLKGSKLITSSKLTELFTQAPNKGMRIRFLSLPGSPSLTDKEIQLLSKECPNIEYLNVSDCLKLKQFITTERDWPLLARLEAKGCLNLERFCSFSPIKILQIQSDSKIEISLEKPTLDHFTISKIKREFEFSLKKGGSPQISLKGKTLPDNDFLLPIIRGKKSVESFFWGWDIILKMPLVFSQESLKNFVTFLDLQNQKIDAQDIQRIAGLNLIHLNRLNLSRNEMMKISTLESLILASWPKLNHLDLSRSHISNKGVEILSQGNWPFLENLNLAETDITAVGIQILVNRAQWPQLKHLNISDNKIQDLAIGILVKGHWPLLENLNISRTDITDRGVQALVSQTKWPKLKHLNLSWNTISDKGLRILPQASWLLLETLNLNSTKISKKRFFHWILETNWPNLQEVHFDEMGNNAAKSFLRKNWHLLEILDLSRSEITQLEIEAIVKTFNWPLLKELNLANNELSDREFEMLVQGNWPLLEVLNLSKTGIAAVGVEILATQAKWPNLKRLFLCQNEIGDQGLQNLAQGNWPLLQALNLYNTQIGIVGIQAIIQKQSWPQLKALNLSQNKIDDAAFTVLCQGNWPHLETLELEDAEITKKALSSLLLKANWPKLEYFSISADWNYAHKKMVERFIKKDLSELEGLELNWFELPLAEIEPVIEKNGYKYPRLKHLKILENDPTFEDKISVLVMTELPLLEELHLENTKISLNMVKSIVNQSKWLNLKHLNISNNELFDEAISVLALGIWPLLENLNLSNTKLSVKGVEAIVTKSKWQQLKSLDVSHNEISDEGLLVLAVADWPLIEEINLKDTKITSKGIELFVEEMKLPNLKKLDISQNEILDEVLEKKFALEGWPLLQHFVYTKGELISNDGISSLQEDPRHCILLTSFEMNFLGAKDVSLSKSPNCCKENIFLIPYTKWDQIESLKLAFNEHKPIQSTVWPLDSKVFDLFNQSVVDQNELERTFFEAEPLLDIPMIIPKEDMASLLKNSDWCNLRKLDVSLMPITDEWLEVFAGEKWPLLEDLNLKKTSITIKSIESFMQNRSSKWPNLKRINLSHNPIQNEGLDVIASSIWNHLEALYLTKTNITDHGIYSLISKSHWPSLKVLDISDNEIGDEGLTKLSSGKWPLLEALYLRKIDVTGKGVVSMTTTSDWPSLKLLDVSENKIWTELFGALSFGGWGKLQNLNLKSTGITGMDITGLSGLYFKHIQEIHFQGLDRHEIRMLDTLKVFQRICPGLKMIVS